MEITGLVIASGIGMSALAITVASVPFVTPAFRKICIPYIPATTTQLNNITKMLSKCQNISPVVDLGSGDGRVVSSSKI